MHAHLAYPPLSLSLSLSLIPSSTYAIYLRLSLCASTADRICEIHGPRFAWRQWRQQKFRCLLLLNNSALILLFLNRLLIKLKVTTCSMRTVQYRDWKGKMLQSQEANWHTATKSAAQKLSLSTATATKCRAKGKCPHMLYIILCMVYTYTIHAHLFVCSYSGSIITVAFYGREREERERIHIKSRDFWNWLKTFALYANLSNWVFCYNTNFSIFFANYRKYVVKL